MKSLPGTALQNPPETGDSDVILCPSCGSAPREPRVWSWWTCDCGAFASHYPLKDLTWTYGRTESRIPSLSYVQFPVRESCVHRTRTGTTWAMTAPLSTDGLRRALEDVTAFLEAEKVLGS